MHGGISVWRTGRAILLAGLLAAGCGDGANDGGVGGSAKGGGGAGGAPQADPLDLASCEGDPGDWNASVELPAMSWSTEDTHPAICALRALDGALEGKRVLCSAEGDHGVSESSRWHSLVARYLVHRWKVRTIAYELTGADAEAWNRYIESGDEADLNKGFEGTANSLADIEELDELLRSLRDVQLELPEGEHLRFVGFDVAVQPGVSVAAISTFLEQVAPDEAAEWTTQLTSGSYEAKAMAAKALADQIVDDEASYTAATDAETYRKALRDARNLEDGFNFLISYSQGDFGTGNAKYREPGLIRNMEDILENTPEDERVVMISHDFHCAKDMPASGALTIAQSPALGTHLAQSTTWGTVYSVIGQLYLGGVDTTFDGPVEFHASTAGLEAEIGGATTADALLVSTTSNLVDFGEKLHVTANGHDAGSIVARDQFDGLIWLRDVTATTLR